MGKIKDLPKDERPREKAIRFGIETLSDEEILAMLIGSGFSGCNAKEVASTLLSDSKGLFNLISKPYQSFLTYKGIGETGALRIAACFEIARRYKFSSSNIVNQGVSSEEIVERYSPKLLGLSQEVLIVVILNSKKQIIHEQTLFKGTESTLEIRESDILRCLLFNRGKYYYLIHNHPSGSFLPSSHDVIFTENISKESEKLNIRMIDHIIISESGYYSFLNQPISEVED